MIVHRFGHGDVELGGGERALGFEQDGANRGTKVRSSNPKGASFGLSSFVVPLRGWCPGRTQGCSEVEHERQCNFDGAELLAGKPSG